MTISGSGSIPPAARALTTRTASAYGIQPRTQAPQPPVGGQNTAAQGRAANDLRAVLNDEEKAYFDQIASLGPITYGRNRTAGVTPEVPTGLRLDVRG